jgi:Ca2+-binding RTX toxin-like protein
MAAHHRPGSFNSFGTAFSPALDAWMEIGPGIGGTGHWVRAGSDAAPEAARAGAEGAGFDGSGSDLPGLDGRGDRGESASAAASEAPEEAVNLPGPRATSLEAPAAPADAAQATTAAAPAAVAAVDFGHVRSAAFATVAAGTVGPDLGAAASSAATSSGAELAQVLPSQLLAADQAAGDGDLSAPLVNVSITTLSNYLRQGFWNWFDGGVNYRSFNIANAGGTGYNGTTLYYNYFGFSGLSGAGTDTDGLTAARRVLVDDVMDYLGEVLGINFVLTSSTSTAVDLFFKDNASGAFANSSLYGSGNGTANHRYIDYSWVNVNSSWSGGTSTVNDYTYQTFVHEIFHALGLGHQGAYNGSATYITDTVQGSNNVNVYLNDSWQQSIMSYISQTENTTINASYAYVITGMAADWQALRSYYGSSAFTGSTVYGFNTNISASVSETLADLWLYADDTAFSIIDDGGTDTLDFSGYSANQLINLRVASASSTVGSISNIGGLTGNMTLAVGTVIENAVGGSGNDTIHGNDFANVLTGNAGNDLFYAYEGADVVYGGTGSDTMYGYGGTDYLYGATGVDGNGDTAGNYLSGMDGDDYLRGGDFADTLYGGTGDDELRGNGGNDFMDGQDGTDEADYFYATSGVTVNLLAGTASGGDGTDTLSNFENIGGSNFDDALTGDNGNNVIYGQGGNDTIVAGGGVDTVYGGSGDDVLQGGFTTDTVYGDAGNDILRVLAGEFYDNSYGGDGTDTLDHSASTYSGSTFDFELGTITGTGINGASAVLSSIEVYQDGSGDNTIVSGGTGATYYGNGGNDYMIAEIGGEFMDGGVGGTDTIDLSRWSGAYVVDMATGSSNYGSESFTNFENLISGAGADSITGTSAANVITTNGGNDTVKGAGGNDTLDTGDGNDSVVGGSGNDTITAGAGEDTVRANAGNDTFIDLIAMFDTEDDVYNGGSGVDTLVHELNWVSTVTFDLAAGFAMLNGVNRDQLIGIENLTVGGSATVIGNGAANVLTVNGVGANLIRGLGGADIVFAGGGNDTVEGGAATDTVYGGDGDDLLRVLGGENYDHSYGDAGTDTLDHSASAFDGHTFDFELGRITGPNVSGPFAVLSSIEIYRDGSGDNTIISDGSGHAYYGNGGNDYMIAEIGAETMDGGAGGKDTIDLARWNGSYVVDMGTGSSNYGGESYTNFENLVSGNGADSITGTSVANDIRTNGGNDTVVAGGGKDLVAGGDGNDSIDGGGGNDQLFGGAGDDTIAGGTGADVLKGNTGSDTLYGGAGADELFGGPNNDKLYAGVDSAEDKFVFDTALNNVDTLFEGSFPTDQILLSNGIFSALLSALGTNEGTLASSQYFEGAGINGNGVGDAVGIWNDSSAGSLYYNPTGGVGGDSILFAMIDGPSAVLSRVDFTLFTST